MFLAEEATAVSQSVDKGFNYFVALFTLIIAYAVFKSIRAPKRNLFAIGFGTICLLVFLVMDAAMIAGWMDLL